MKSFQAAKFVLCAVIALVGIEPASAKVRVSVAEFTDKSSSGASVGPGCHGYVIWADRLGGAFADLLVESLSADPRLEVLERGSIGKIYDHEVNLLNSEKDKTLRRGKFKKAKITFVGVVDGFEYCDGGGRAALNVGRLFGVGNITPSLRKSSASVSVLIRAIDTETGEVLAHARAKKKQSKKSLGVSLELPVIDLESGQFRQTPLAEAIRAAVTEAGQDILERLNI